MIVLEVPRALRPAARIAGLSGAEAGGERRSAVADALLHRRFSCVSRIRLLLAHDASALSGLTRMVMICLLAGPARKASRNFGFCSPMLLRGDLKLRIGFCWERPSKREKRGAAVLDEAHIGHIRGAA